MRKSGGNAAGDAATEGGHEAAIPPGPHLSIPPKLGLLRRSDPVPVLRTFLDSARVLWIKTSSEGRHG